MSHLSCNQGNFTGLIGQKLFLSVALRFPNMSPFPSAESLIKREKITIGLPSNGEDIPWGLIQ